MQSKTNLYVSVELMNVIDQQISILEMKTFASFTSVERCEFKNRQQRIRELEQQLALTRAEQTYVSGVFAGLYD